MLTVHCANAADYMRHSRTQNRREEQSKLIVRHALRQITGNRSGIECAARLMPWLIVIATTATLQQKETNINRDSDVRCLPRHVVRTFVSVGVASGTNRSELLNAKE